MHDYSFGVGQHLPATLDQHDCPEKLTSKGPLQGKWTKISAKARGHTAVQETQRQDKGLAQYLALPVEEYSLLDPSWITR